MKKSFFIAFLIGVQGLFAQNHYIVTTTNDPANPFNTVQGEFRWAIQQANAHAGVDYIDFNITDGTPATINLVSSLPALTSPVIIDGNTQPANGYTGSALKVNLVSDNIIFYLYPLSSGSTVKNILINNGLNYDGLVISESSGNTFENNVVYKSSFLWIIAGDADNNTFKGNILGTDNAFSTTSAYSNEGIRLTKIGTRYPDNTIFGGLTNGEGNYFYNMLDSNAPLDIQAGTGNKVVGNIFIHNSKNIDINGNSGCLGNNCKTKPVYQVVASSSNLLTVWGTGIAGDLIEVYLSNSGGIDAIQLLGRSTVNASGQWSLSVNGYPAGTKVIATATNNTDGTSEFGLPVTATANNACCTQPAITSSAPEGVDAFCLSNPVLFQLTCNNTPAGTGSYSWNFGDGNSTTSSGAGISHTYTAAGNYTVSVQSTISGCPPVNLSDTLTVLNCNTTSCCTSPSISVYTSSGNCVNQAIGFQVNCNAGTISNASYNWNFGDGNTQSTSTANVTHAYTATGSYTVTLVIIIPGCNRKTVTYSIAVGNCAIPCEDCISSFAPDAGDYVVSLWVREDQPVSVNTYTSGVEIKFLNNLLQPIGTVISFTANASNVIIDGWQKVEGKFTVPQNAYKMVIDLKNNATTANVDAYFDDIRIHPFNSGFKSYVYDPVSLRLMAELDQNNYATFYEYDEEGKLVHIKKETERGIKTIKEAVNNTRKK